MKTLLLIDANSLIHRAFHALPPLTTPDGRPAQALYGVSSILLKLWKTEQPEYAAALFDRPEPTFRKERSAEYKATRPKAADELIEQIIAAHSLFPRFGVPVFEKTGFEADDLIATLARRFKDEDGVRIVVLTGDLDTLQLVRGDQTVVRVLKTGVSSTVTYDEPAVIERYGLRPAQLADYKALVGDQSDNVRGVSGIGPKTAREILQKFGTLENAFGAGADDSKVAARLLPHREDAELAKFLVLLRYDAPIPIGRIGELAVRLDEAALTDYFTALGFSSLVKRITSPEEPSVLPSTKTVRSARTKIAQPPQGAMF